MRKLLSLSLVALLGLLPLMGFAPKQTIKLVVLHTTAGDITLYLYQDTPLHRENFLKLVASGFYDGIGFHRIIKDFMIQGGDPNSKDADPNNDGTGGPGYEIDAEIRPQYFHRKGVLAAARNGDNVNPQRRSSGSQFYIVQGRKFRGGEVDTMAMQRFSRTFFNEPNRVAFLRSREVMQLQYTNRDSLSRLYKRMENEMLDAYRNTPSAQPNPKAREAYTTVGGTPHLDMEYTAFGEVVSGLEIVDAIAAVKTSAADRPVEPVKIIKAEIIELTPKKFEKTYKRKLPDPA